jgi:sulfur-oxidizing protein SoxY
MPRSSQTADAGSPFPGPVLPSGGRAGDVPFGDVRCGKRLEGAPSLDPASARCSLHLLTRRQVLGLAGIAAGLVAEAGLPRAARDARAAAGPPHLPRLTLPVLTENGAKVPVVVDVPHPMAPDHYIRRIQVVNPRDPVPSKGVFELTPLNGRAYLAFQARLDEGVSEVTVTAECSRHGTASAVETVQVAGGAGGCAAPAPPARATSSEIRPPVIRIPRLLRGERIQPGDVLDVQVTMQHPSRTGLAGRNGIFVQETEPFFLQELLVYHGALPVSRFGLTAALSDDPLITFRLRAARAEPVRVIVTNSRGQRFEASHPIRFT